MRSVQRTGGPAWLQNIIAIRCPAYLEEDLSVSHHDLQCMYACMQLLDGPFVPEPGLLEGSQLWATGKACCHLWNAQGAWHGQRSMQALRPPGRLWQGASFRPAWCFTISMYHPQGAWNGQPSPQALPPPGWLYQDSKLWPPRRHCYALCRPHGAWHGQCTQQALPPSGWLQHTSLLWPPWLHCYTLCRPQGAWHDQRYRKAL